MPGQRVYVDSPTTTPLPYGLLSVADDRAQDSHWQQGVEYQSDNCVVTLTTTTGYCITPAGTNEQQQLAIGGSPTGGTFTLTYGSETTAPIPWNATAAQVQTALEALIAFDPGDVAVTGGPAPGAVFIITFQGRLASRDVPQISGNGAGLTPSGTAFGSFIQQGVQTPKTLTTGAAVTGADAFTVYLLRACGPVGDSDAQARAMRMFNGSEQTGVEKGFWDQITKSGAGAVDITPASGNALTPVLGVAVLENYAATHYGGRPIIHIPRAVASAISATQQIERHGSHMETKLGALVSAGGGYDSQKGPNGASPGAGNQFAWIFATGAVSLWKGPATVQGPLFRQVAVSQNQPANEWLTLVERTYLTSPDCMIAATKVQLI